MSNETVSLEVAIEVVLSNGPTFETIAGLCKMAVEAERNTLAAWMIQFGFATGHGDTMEQLVDALGSEIVDRIEFEIDTEREACAKLCEKLAEDPMMSSGNDAIYCAESIRERSNI